MLVKNIRYATVIINCQRLAIFLVDVASSLCTRTTYEFCYTATVEFFAAPYARQFTLLLVGPSCTILQPQICCAREGLAVAPLRYYLTSFWKFVINYACQLRILSGQAHINLGFGAAIYIVYRTYGSNNVTGNINLVVACAGYFAVCILHSVHVNLAVCRINCAVAVLLIGINDVDFAAVNVNGCSADVSKQAVAYAGNIYIAVDVNRAANCSAVACMCINACSAVFVEAAAVAIKSYLYVAVNGGAACIAVNTCGRVIALNVHIYIAVNSQAALGLTDTLCALAALCAIELNNQLVSLHGAVCIYILCNACITLAGISYINSQSFAAGINSSVLSKIHTLSAFAAYVNGSILGKFVAAVALDNSCLGIFRILVCITGQRRSKIGNSRLGVRTLAVIGKLNLAALNGYAVIGQTANNFNSAQQVFRIIYIIAIGQLACQCIQNTVQFCAVFGIYFAAISYHVDSRILFCIADDDITGSIICGRRAIIVVLIEYSRITAVIVDINSSCIILENQASISCTTATIKFINMGNPIIFSIMRCRLLRYFT